MKKTIALVSLLAAMVLPATAMAYPLCKFYKTMSVPAKPGDEVPGPWKLTFTGFTVNVDSSKPVGSIIGSADVSLRAPLDANGNATLNNSMECPNTVASVDYESTVGPKVTVPGVPFVYQTSIPGIGLQLFFDGYDYLTYTQNIGTSPRLHANGGQNLHFRFVKTGPITSGGTITDVSTWFANGPFGREVWVSVAPDSPIIVIPKIPTCSLSTPDVVVNLEDADATDFPSVSSTAKEKDFNVSLSCSGGDPGTKTEMWMSFADQTTPGNVSQNLSLTSASTATGVGVQIMRNGTPVSFDPTVNQFKVQDVLPGNSTVDIPLKARYVRTGAMTAGKVQGISVFTIDYK